MGKTYNAGVKDYRETYWMPDYKPKETDLLACFKIIPQAGVPREEAAAAAADEFDNIFRVGGLPDNIAEYEFDGASPAWIIQVMRECDFASSNGEARRLVAQGAVSLDGERITSDEATIPNDGDARILKVGKRRFAKVKVG